MPDFYFEETEEVVSDPIEIEGNFIVEVYGDFKGGVAKLLRSQDDTNYSIVKDSILTESGHYVVNNIGTSYYIGVFEGFNQRKGTPLVTMRYTQ